jgi:hypothetical protein
VDALIGAPVTLVIDVAFALRGEPLLLFAMVATVVGVGFAVAGLVIALGERDGAVR